MKAELVVIFCVTMLPAESSSLPEPWYCLGRSMRVPRPIHGYLNVTLRNVHEELYYNAQMKIDINFPAGVLQPPLYDPKLDDAPSLRQHGLYNWTRESTHGFDDEGRESRRPGT